MRQFLTVCVWLLGATAALAASGQTPHDEEVTFRSGSITIAGTLSIPPGNGPFPALVLLSGSGPQNRDSELFGFRPFKLIADSFAQRGIAVLRCDDRGVGGSSGSIAAATSEDFADDALAAVRMLGARRDIDRARVGILGHSEGAIVGAIAASRSSDVAFLVWMAGSAVRGREILAMQAASLARAAGASESAVDEIVRHQAALMAAIAEDATEDTLMALGRTLVAAQMAAVPNAHGGATEDLTALSERVLKQSLTVIRSPWMRFFIGFDPSTALRQVKCPVFAAFGGRDQQVPEAANRTRLEMALTEARNRQVTVRVYPEANHLFMQAVTGQLAEYATLPKAFVAPLLDDIAAWITRW